MKRLALVIAIPLLASAVSNTSRGQNGASAEGLKQRWQMGLVVQATGTCTGILAAVPVPMDWPEQQVQELEKDVSPHVTSLRYRVLAGGVKQMMITIPELRAGTTATALVTFGVIKTRSGRSLAETATWRIPAKPGNELRPYLGVSPLIETNHPDIQRLAAELVAGQATDWDKVKSIYQGTRTRVRYKFDPKLESAVAALRKGEGDCGELTSVFIALCRSQKVPACAVWVIPTNSVQETGHSYPEFYLEQENGQGWWFPCQVAGAESQFGEIDEVRPILQKGDNFQVPGERKPLRFVAQTFQAKNATANPRVEWVQRQLKD